MLYNRYHSDDNEEKSCEEEMKILFVCMIKNVKIKIFIMTMYSNKNNHNADDNNSSNNNNNIHLRRCGK